MKNSKNTKDTTTFNVSLNNGSTDKTSHKTYTVEVVQSNNDKSGFPKDPIYTSFVFPLVTTLLVFFITRFVTRKKEKASLKRIRSETDKNQEEITQMKSSFQPIVISSLQTIQNEIFKDKISSLKGIIKIKSDMFTVEQTYHEGKASIEDTHVYYRNVYWNVNDSLLNEIKKNSMDNSNLFPENIRDEFNNLISLLVAVYNIQKEEVSLSNQEIPSEAKEKLIAISGKIDQLINMVRYDLHLDNTFIHDFIKEHQKPVKK